MGDLDALTELETEFEERIKIEPQLMDLCNLLSVKKAATDLKEKLPNGRLDVLIANAGIGGWTGIDWGKLIWQFLTSPLTVASKPAYQIGDVGAVTKRQIPVKKGERKEDADLRGNGNTEEEEALGEVFTANVFGHYMLIHWLTFCMKKTRNENGRGQDSARIIWVSSAQALSEALDPSKGDLQGIKSQIAYESSKRLTDLLVLTSQDEQTSSFTTDFYSTERDKSESANAPNPKMYLTHPGYCVTTIFAIPLIMVWGQIIMFHIARLFGSVWHTIDPYAAAVSMVWLALTEQTTLDKQEQRDGKCKWGSAVGRIGGERSLKTEVEGWGFGGIPGEKGPRIGLLIDEKITKESVKKFRDDGASVWRQMEELRKKWEDKLDKVDG